MGNKIKVMKGEEIHKHYEMKQKLGSGTFATVKYAVKKANKKAYAIKVPSSFLILHTLQTQFKKESTVHVGDQEGQVEP